MIPSSTSTTVTRPRAPRSPPPRSPGAGSPKGGLQAGARVGSHRRGGPPPRRRPSLTVVPVHPERGAQRREPVARPLPRVPGQLGRQIDVAANVAVEASGADATADEVTLNARALVDLRGAPTESPGGHPQGSSSLTACPGTPEADPPDGPMGAGPDPSASVPWCPGRDSGPPAAAHLLLIDVATNVASRYGSPSGQHGITSRHGPAQAEAPWTLEPLLTCMFVSDSPTFSDTAWSPATPTERS